MPRGKGGPTSATTSPHKRLVRFTNRKEKLRKKARDLATLCDVDVAVVCTGPGGVGDLDYWPSNEAVNAAVRRYNALEPDQRARHREDHANHVAGEHGDEREKLARARDSDVASALGSYDASLRGMSEEKLWGMLASIEGSLEAAWNRLLKLQAPPGGAADRATFLPGLVHEEEATEEDSVSVTNYGVPPPTEPRGDAGAVGGGLVLPPPSENPNPPNAVTADAGKEEVVAENTVTGEYPGDEVQILQPPGDADADDAEWMRSLIDDLKKQPRPYDPAAYAAGVDYINVGSSWMELDAYDLILFDLGMPLPCVALNFFDYDDDGEPLKLWSWDNSMPSPPKRACAT